MHRRVIINRLYIKLILLFLIFANPLYSEGLDSAEGEKTTISHTDAIILGLVEGITEYLPVSSTGHLIITNHLLGLDNETPLSEDSDYTLKQAADAYAIIIQGGAIIAVVLLYWGRISSIISGILGKDPKGLALAKNLIIAFIPAAVLGLAFDDIIDAYLFNTNTVIIALIAGAILMIAVEHWRKSKKKKTEGPDLHELSYKQVFTIGLLQCVAMCPGTSRSMMTIVGGYAVGLSPVRAAEFSFLLGLITLSAASGYKIVTSGPEMIQAIDIGPLITGIAVSAIAAALAIKWLVSWLTRHGLTIFAWYRTVLALTLLLIM